MRTAAVLLVFGLAALSCAPASTASNPHVAGRLHAPNPVNVTEHLDTAHSTSLVVDSAGGSLTLDAGNGITFTLVIPPGAVLFSTLVRMTAVASLGGFPWRGGLLAAVHIEPDGMILAKPALLQFTGIPAPPAGTSVTGFLYEGNGTDFHLYATNVKNPSQVQLVHFSSPGLGAASPQDTAAQEERDPAYTLAELEQDVYPLLVDLGNGGNPGQIASEIQSLFDGFGTRVLAPEMDKALQSLTPDHYLDFWQAYIDLQAAERYAELIGISIANYHELLNKWADAMPAMIKNLINACFNDHDVQADFRALDMLSWAAKTGIEVPGALDAISRCLTFKLDFDTDLKSELPQSKVHSHLTATGAPMSNAGGGVAPLEYVTFEMTMSHPIPGCGVTYSTRVDQPFAALGIGGLQLGDELGRRQVLVDFFVFVKPGKAVETTTVVCPHLPSIESHGTYYNTNWETLHENEHIERAGYTTVSGIQIPAVDSYAISGWNIHNGSALFADKTYTQNGHYADVSVAEVTMFKLWHVPEGQGLS